MKTIQNDSICFLILHYMNIELTSKTIESVLTLNNFRNSKIVVVDNASPNNSGFFLKQKYKDMPQIHIVLSNSNVGFSAGNNIGFRYIKKYFSPNFVITINNDILFPQKDFIDKLYVLYAEKPFWVAGPDIYIPHRDYHSSPLYEHSLDSEEVESLIKKAEWEQQQFIKKVSLYGLKLYFRDCHSGKVLVKLGIKLNRWFRGYKKNYKESREDVVLQGACLIFDKRYCEKNDELFLPLTFMYGEEIILAAQCKKNNWIIRYFPELLVWHSCGGSMHVTKLKYKDYRMKKMAGVECCKEAYKKYMGQI